MIKIFRKIRQNLILKNKTSKYFKYAIGEIILVVIGILIALQINNWNETKKLKEQEKEILASLYKETENNNNTLTKLIEQNDWIQTMTLKLLDSIENGHSTFEKSSIVVPFAHNISQINYPVLEGILNNESKLIIQQNYLISDLRKLNNLYDDIKKDEFYLDDNWNTNLTQFIIKCGFDFRLDTKIGRKISLKELNKCGYNKEQFKALISLTSVIKASWIGYFKSTKKQSEILLKKLDSIN